MKLDSKNLAALGRVKRSVKERWLEALPKNRNGVPILPRTTAASRDAARTRRNATP